VAAQSQTTIKASGLNINPNSLDLPNGALVRANNVIIKRENVIESRRGLSDWSEGLGISTDRTNQIFEYKDRILANYSDKLAYATGLQNIDGTEIFNDFFGNYSSASNYRMRSVESNKNLYLTTSDGIKKISAASADDFTTSSGFVRDAGAVKAIDFTTTLQMIQGQTDGFLPIDSTVAYRIVWGYKDANDNLILGSPSTRNLVYNYASNAYTLDFNKLLVNLDLIGAYTGGGLISNTDYYSTYKLSSNSDGNVLKNNLIGLASKLDTDLIFGGHTEVAITGVSVANPTTITTGTAHGLTTGQYVTIRGTNTTASTLGSFVATVVTPTTFTIPVNVTLVTVGTGTLYVSPTTPLVLNTIAMDGAAVVTLEVAGPAANYIAVGDWIDISGITTTNIAIFNNKFQVTAVSAISSNISTITFTYTPPTTTTTITAITATNLNVGAKLNSYSYQYITNNSDDTQYGGPLVSVPIDSPITAGETSVISYTLSRILSRLAIEKPAVILASLITNYISTIDSTDVGGVKLKISIPTDSQGNQLPSDYFMQVYRSNVFTATGSSQLGLTVIPDDELHLIYEYFPTNVDFSNKYIIVNDEYPDTLAQTNTPLYTNPITGDGILQSNDIPPYANDINYFKNYTFFANTKTRHIIPNLQLVGVDNIVTQDKITIANDTVSSTYTFVDGVQEVTTFTVSGTAAAKANQQFFVNSANDINRYYFWWSLDGSTSDPLGKSAITSVGTGATPLVTTTNPHGLKTGDTVTISGSTSTPSVDGTYVVTVATGSTFNITPAAAVSIAGGAAGTAVLSGIIGISIPIVTGDSIATQALRAYETINNVVSDFTVSFTPTTFVITNTGAGITTDAAIGNSTGLAVTVNTQGDGEDAANGKVLISRTLSAATNIDATARSFIRVINASTTSPIYAYYTSGDNTSPGQIALESKVLSDTPFYIIASGTQFRAGTFGIGNSFNPDISPIHVVPTSAGIITSPGGGFIRFTTPSAHNLQNGYQVIITNSNASGTGFTNVDGIYTVYNVTTTTFDVLHSVTGWVNGTKFSWELTSDSVVSTNTARVNRLYYSKFKQADAVPLLNYFDIGPEDKEILRIFPLRTSLFVFKEDGLYRISGESAPFTVQPFDLACALIAPDTVVNGNNSIYAWTDKGISNITESGVNEISTPVDIDILKLASYENFGTIAWGVNYDSDSSYTVYTGGLPSDEVATIGYRFSNLTNTWTNVTRSQTCGLISSRSDTLYMGSGIDNIINKERKNFDRTDYADRDFTLSINTNSVNITGSTIQFTDVSDIDVGDVLYQNQYITIYKFNSLLQKLDIDPGVSDSNYYSTLAASVGADMRAKIVALANKLDADVGVSQTTFLQHITDKSITVLSNSIANPTVVTGSAVTNLVDGRIVLISGTQTPVSQPSINTQYQISGTGTWGVSTTFTVPVSVTSSGGTGLTAVTQSTNFLDIQACYNAMITMLNNDSGVTFTNYSQVDFNTPIEAVITAVDRVSKTVTLNITGQWIIGDVQVYKAIDKEVIYAPLSFGDVLKLKQVFESTVMFSNTAFTSARVSFSSDLKPDFIPVSFNNLGNGIFGSYSNPGFGFGYFGGGGNAKPFRTLIPLQTQRCRFINLKYNHMVAREINEVYGVTLTANISESVRAYR